LPHTKKHWHAARHDPTQQESSHITSPVELMYTG
jgi:hypothetical protein